MEDENLDENLEPTPAAAPDMPGQSDPSPADSANNATPENPINTGLPETPQDHLDDQKEESNEELSSDDDFFEDDNNVTEGENSDQISSGSDEQEQTEGDPDPGDGTPVRNVTIVRPIQQFFYQADGDTVYHSFLENDETDPVPVVITETLIEKDPGIMDKRLEDYTVTEAMLLLILLTLWLRMIFDYLGRRKT